MIHDRPSRCVEVYIYPPTQTPAHKKVVNVPHMYNNKRPTHVVGAELEEDVGAGSVLEEVVEAHDVPVPERAVDAHLGLELLWAALRGQGFGDSRLVFSFFSRLVVLGARL